MQAKVPQNVDIEDKVIGSLTLRQFMIIFCAVALATFLYLTIGKFSKILWFLITSMIGTGAAILAFYKYGDQNLEIFVMSALKTFQLPRKRVWLKSRHTQENEPVLKKEEQPKDPRKKSVQEVRADLSRLAEIVDSGSSAFTDQGRMAMTEVPNLTPEPQPPRDILENTLKSVDQIIGKTIKKDSKKEPVIAEMASVPPDTKFKYPKIKH